MDKKKAVVKKKENSEGSIQIRPTLLKCLFYKERKKEKGLLTYPAALPDPVAQPPVTKGYAASCGQEEDDVDDEDQWTSCCLNVCTIDRPGDCTAAFFLCFHQLL